MDQKIALIFTYLRLDLRHDRPRSTLGADGAQRLSIQPDLSTAKPNKNVATIGRQRERRHHAILRQVEEPSHVYGFGRAPAVAAAGHAASVAVRCDRLLRRGSRFNHEAKLFSHAARQTDIPTTDNEILKFTGILEIFEGDLCCPQEGD